MTILSTDSGMTTSMTTVDIIRKLFGIDAKNSLEHWEKV